MPTEPPARTSLEPHRSPEGCSRTATSVVAIRAHGILLAALLLFTAASYAHPRALPSAAEVRSAWRSSEAILLDRHGAVLHELRVDPSGRRRAWTPLAAVSPALLRTVIQAEDRRFYRHRGVDWRAIAAAAWERLETGRARGASTLSMQLAAMLDDRKAGRPGSRNALSKLRQMRAALALEKSWSKDEILEAYLNLAGFRGELQGIGAAARGLFGKTPGGLDEAESLLLAALLPAPATEPPGVARRACALARSGGFGVDCNTLQDLASRLSDPPERVPAPALAPHLAQRLLGAPDQRVTTTLDAALQRMATEALREQLLALRDRNIRDGAAIVADNASGEILVYVGSAGPYSRSPLVDGARAPRQAGSTLKPFLYALALDQRYLTAASLLDDSPVSLETPNGLYIPQNYDRDFKGPVSVRSALAGSLNVPAVRTLALVGVEPFRERLRDFGYAGIAREGEYYGYSLALGSAEVTLLEQVAAYRALSIGGRAEALRVQPAPASGDGRTVVGAGAAFIVADILADRAGRAITFGLDGPLSTHYWSAVKTGTSKGMRDNWCIGFSRRYTVGVWVGNFEGDPMHDVSGITGAAPVWLNIMDSLEAREPSPSAPPEPPASVVAVPITFRPAVEPPRREWFLSGTEVREVVRNDPETRGPRIVSPPDGVMIALDPDIPPGRQLIVITVAAPPSDAFLRLDGQPLGPAAAPIKWSPRPGRHRLALVRADGKVIDTIAFSVRPIAAARAPRETVR